MISTITVRGWDAQKPIGILERAQRKGADSGRRFGFNGRNMLLAVAECRVIAKWIDAIRIDRVQLVRVLWEDRERCRAFRLLPTHPFAEKRHHVNGILHER